MKTLRLTVGREQGGQRLDLFIAAALPDLSRRRVRGIIDVGGAYVNDRRVRIASRTVQRGDRVRIEYSETALKTLKAPPPELTAAAILYDRFGVIAINKPPGLPSQATKDQAVVHVVPCLEAYFRAQGRPRRNLILVHRLDKETSGVLLIAEGADEATWLTEQFRDRSVSKVYWAVCHGVPKERKFVERSPLSPIDRKTGDVRPVRSGGKPAVTQVRVLAVNAKLNLSLVECRPETGRSHQIRVHLAMNGLPIVGDKRYQAPPGSGGHAAARAPLPPALAELTTTHHFLHAARLEFQPAATSGRVVVEAPPPERFAAFVSGSGLTH